MEVMLSPENRRAIGAHLEAAYPNEGAGFLLGEAKGDVMQIVSLLPLQNQREAEAQYHRYELAPQDFVRAEVEAARLGLSLIGVFHSHPDHPARPSEFDRDHALPNFAYLITSVVGGEAQVTTAWSLREDRMAFEEAALKIVAIQKTQQERLSDGNHSHTHPTTPVYQGQRARRGQRRDSRGGSE